MNSLRQSAETDLYSKRLPDTIMSCPAQLLDRFPTAKTANQAAAGEFRPPLLIYTILNIGYIQLSRLAHILAKISLNIAHPASFLPGKALCPQ